MKIVLKFFLLWILLTVLMLISWPIGVIVGNAVTQSSPPSVNNDSTTAFIFLFVCLINSLVITALIWTTRRYTGLLKGTVLILYCFVIQFLLTQMETFFFAESINITAAQIVSILVSGFVVASVSIPLGILVSNKLTKPIADTPLMLEFTGRSGWVIPMIVLVCLGYPVLYFVFGYYVAWQNEALRIFYTQSSEIKPFFSQLINSLSEGIYFFQILRAIIWVAISIPVILMLQHLRLLQYLLVGLLSALLPSILLFLPNPYMPAEIAMSHFVETSISNFLWGVSITVVVNKYLVLKGMTASRVQ
jgi:hypothetical protein